MQIRKLAVITLVILVPLGFTAACEAQIYKYKDESGHWQFTDKKPEKGIKTEEITPVPGASTPVSGTVAREDDWVDLIEKFKSQYSPQSVVEVATLAVVSIETTVGVGSGFFVSDSGHLLTSMHVIRPKTSTGWQQQQDAFREEERRIDRMFENLRMENNQLDSMYARLQRMREVMEASARYLNPPTLEEYRSYKQRFEDREYLYKRALKEANEIRRDFNERKKMFNRISTTASISQHFKVIFKDSTTGSAHLLKLSPQSDLALLQVRGYITPHLNLNVTDEVRQGLRVYALGSPLGRRDFVTSGIITSVSRDEIVTDANVLPGNSGGPLIDENGYVVGINTMKLSADQQGHMEGFGIAVPISKARADFPELLESK